MDNNLLPELEAMRHGVTYFFEVKLRQFSVKLRPVSNSEMMECYSSVTQYINNIPAAKRTKMDEDNALAREILKKACCEMDSDKPGKFTDPVLNAMNNDEILYFYGEWRAVCDRVNPQLEQLPIEVIRSTVNELKKNPPTDLDSQLIELSFGQLVNLARYLLTSADLQTDKLSGGSSTQ